MECVKGIHSGLLPCSFCQVIHFKKYLTIGRRVLSGGVPSFAFHRIRMDLILLLVISPLGSLAFAFMVVLVN